MGRHILVQDVVSEILNDEKIVKRFDYLYSRWQDERDYEDWQDYHKAICKVVQDKFKFVRITKTTKRPIGFVGFSGGQGFKVWLKIKGNRCWLAAAWCRG